MSLLNFKRETTLFFSSVYSKDEKLLDYLLHSAQYFPVPVDHKHPMYITNIYGNTPLHAAVRTGNSKAVELLVEKSEEIQASESEVEETDITLMKNKSGETPFLTAAAFGWSEIVKLKIVRYLTKKQNDELLLDHRQRDDYQSILHVAAPGEYFGLLSSLFRIKCHATNHNFFLILLFIAETALLLLKLDKSLGEFKDRGGRACLYILAEMTSAFKSGCSMSIFTRYA
ncbi:ankyrin repeat-containing protein [Salix suchowensis]|nr:ankyrin repeat-containing protein [Salix suchowensis]